MEKIINKVFILAIFSSVDSFLLPDQHELVYDYHTETSASVIGNEEDTTDFTLNATITLKTYNELTFVTISNIQYDFIVGNLAPMPDYSKLKMDSLEKPFAMRYQPNGKINEILTDKDDELWSINLKKGISSMFQLDMTEMAKDGALEDGFNTDETTLNGQCSVSYVLLQKDDGYEVVKNIDSTSCLGQTWYKNTEIIMGVCASDKKQPLTAMSKRTYSLDKIKGDITIDSIKNENSISSRPITGGSYVQLIWAEQNMKMIKKEKLNDSAAPSIEGMTNMKLTAKFLLDNDKKFDLSGGRMMNDYETIMTGLKSDFEELASFNKTYTIDENSPMSNVPDLMNIILRKMEILDEDQLNTLLANLAENEAAIETFYGTISKVGTYSSMMFIKNYIQKNPTFEKLPEDMLDSLASSWKTPDVNMMKEYAILLEPEAKLDKMLWDKVMLVISSMLSKVKNHEEIQDIISFFIDKFKAADDEIEQMKFIAAMKNIKAKPTNKFLVTVFNGNTETTPFIRTMAIWALKDAHSGRPDLLDSLYLPLILKKQENFAVRCAAMDVYMDEPTVEKMMKLAFAMAGEEEDNVMSAFRTRVKSLSKSKLPCYKLVAEYAKQLLNDFPVKDNSVFQGTFQHLLDFSDPYRGYSRMSTYAKTGQLYRDGFFTMMIDPIPDFIDPIDSYKSLFVRGRLNSSSEPRMSLKNADGLSYFRSLIKDSTECKSMIWNIIAVKNGEVVDIFDKITCPTNEHLKKFILSFAQMDKQVVLPTDVGLPAVFFVQKLSKDIIEGRFDPMVFPTVELGLDVIIMTSLKFGVKFYNPASNMWHGVKRHHEMNVEIPFLLFNNASSVDGEIFSQYYFNVNERDGVIKNQGFKTSVHSDVFVEDFTGQILHEIQLAKTGKPNKEFTIFKFDMPSAVYELALYNCAEESDESQIATIQRFLVKKLNQAAIDICSRYFNMRYIYKHIFDMPRMDTCGIRLLRKPNHFVTGLMTVRDYSTEDFDVHTMTMKAHGNDTSELWSWSKKSFSPMKFIWTFVNSFGEDRTTIQIDGEQELDNFTAIGEYKLFTTDVEDPTNMTVYFKATDEQDMNEMVVYDECIKIKTPLECAKKLTSLKNYVIDIKLHSVSKKFYRWYMRAFQLFHALYSDHMVNSKDITTIDKDTMKIQVKLTKMYDTADVRLTNAAYDLVFKDLPLEDMFFTMMPSPISSHFSFWDIFNTFNPHLKTITVTKDAITSWSGRVLGQPAEGNWTEVISECEQEGETKNCKFEIFVQMHPEHKLALRLVVPEGELEVYRVGFEDDVGKYNVGMLWNTDVVQIDDSGYYYDDRFKVKRIDGPRMFLQLKDETFVVDFTNTKIYVHVPLHYAIED